MHARLAKGDARLLTRTGLGWTDKYPANARAIAALGVEAEYLDGEPCAVLPMAPRRSA
jgi:ATP-dependent DNA ligase